MNRYDDPKKYEGYNYSVSNNSFNKLGNTLEEFHKEMAEKQEAILLEQLSDLINDGVLVIQQRVPVMTTTYDPDGKVTCSMNSAIRLTYQGKELIDELKTENQKLREALKLLRETL